MIDSFTTIAGASNKKRKEEQDMMTKVGILHVAVANPIWVILPYTLISRQNIMDKHSLEKLIKRNSWKLMLIVFKKTKNKIMSKLKNNKIKILKGLIKVYRLF